MAELNLTPARKRLSAAIAASDVWDLKKLSLEAKRSHAYLQQFITRNSPRVLPEDVREVIAAALGGHPDDYKDGGVPMGATRVHSGEPIQSVPIYDIRASAGAGALVEDGPPTGFQPYREQELRAVLEAAGITSNY